MHGIRPQSDLEWPLVVETQRSEETCSNISSLDLHVYSNSTSTYMWIHRALQQGHRKIANFRGPPPLPANCVTEHTPPNHRLFDCYLCMESRPQSDIYSIYVRAPYDM